MQAKELGVQTGSPLFCSVEVLDSGSHCIGSELESLMNLAYYIFSKGRLPWEMHPQDLFKRLGMLIRGWRQEMEKRVEDSRAQSMLSDLHKLFVVDQRYDCSCSRRGDKHHAHTWLMLTDAHAK